MVRKTLKKFRRILGAYKLLTFSIIGLAAAGTAALLHNNLDAEAFLDLTSAIVVISLISPMWQDLRGGKYGINVLALVAVVMSLVLHQYWTAGIVALALSSGKLLERIASVRAQTALRDLLKSAPDRAHVVQKGKEIDVPARDIVEREKFVVRPGELVPVDAVILEGSSSFNELLLTGEKAPQGKEVGDQILSGTINLDNSVLAQATHTVAASQYQQVIRMVRAAVDSQAPFVRLADHYSIPFAVAALAIGGVAWVLSGQSIRFLEVIVVASPGALVLGAPVALVAGMSQASRQGIIMKTGRAMELLARAKTIAFDKAGTLTDGTPEVVDIVAFSPYKKQDVIVYAAALEQDSDHSLAQAIVNAATVKKLKLPKTKHVHEITGRGLEAHVKGQEIVVGRFILMSERNVRMPEKFSHGAIAQTATYVAIGGRLAGYITFKDNLQKDAGRALDSLRRLGVKETLMITGDNQAAASAVAKQLFVTRFVADTLPGDKLRTLESTAEKPIAYVGNGVSDAPLLTAADVGIALGARGNTTASESADVVIMRSSLVHVAQAVAAAKRALRAAGVTIAAGIGVSFILMLVFATGRFSPLTGAVTGAVLTVLVIPLALQAHRAARFSVRH